MGEFEVILLFCTYNTKSTLFGAISLSEKAGNVLQRNCSSVSVWKFTHGSKKAAENLCKDLNQYLLVSDIPVEGFASEKDLKPKVKLDTFRLNFLMLVETVSNVPRLFHFNAAITLKCCQRNMDCKKWKYNCYRTCFPTTCRYGMTWGCTTSTAFDDCNRFA